MFNLKLNDGTPNFNIPDKMKFDTMASWIKSIGREKYENEDYYNPALDLVETYTHGLSEEFVFSLAICVIFLNIKYETDIRTILDLMANNDLIGHCYRKFVEEGGLKD